MRISIHALLAESDPAVADHAAQYNNFYPRSPCGERLCYRVERGRRVCISIHALLAESDVTGWQGVFAARLFLSTLSLRRATIPHPLELIIIHISIHALLAESDAPTARAILQYRHFYPRSPCGERQRSVGRSLASLHFYPRSPCGERRSNLHSFAAFS